MKWFEKENSYKKYYLINKTSQTSWIEINASLVKTVIIFTQVLASYMHPSMKTISIWELENLNKIKVSLVN